MFKELLLKSKYKSEEDNIFEDFYKPVLKSSNLYKRAVGYFSPPVLLNAPVALSCFAENDGKAKLIFGKLISKEDFEAVKNGLEFSFDTPEFGSLQDLIQNNSGTLLEYRIRLLAWLFANEKLELKIALRPNGLFHQKIAVLTDSNGDQISFSGSANETKSALDPEYNSEEIKIFRSWEEGQSDYVQSDNEDFDILWDNQAINSKTFVCGVPDVINEGLKIVADTMTAAPNLDEENEAVRKFISRNKKAKDFKPKIPKKINGKDFKLKDHQEEALREWAKNGYNGILELATGAGKTITAIYAATQFLLNNEGFVIIVAVPYLDLANQWVEELKLFNIRSLKCFGSQSDWGPQTAEYLSRNRHTQKEQLAIVVVNKTLKGTKFQSFASKLEGRKLLFIGDECHHHGSISFAGKLISHAKYRIGLSATPFHYLDGEANKRLEEIYNKPVFKYTLEEAVKDKVLTPYEYKPVPVVLTSEETKSYLEMTAEIGRLSAISGSGEDTSNIRLKKLLMKRARLIGTAENKLVELRRLLQIQPVEKHTLFYCSDGSVTDSDDFEEIDVGEDNSTTKKQRVAVNEILEEFRVRASPFTSDERNSQRKQILSNFKEGIISVMIAIKCLDEGIDVPACRTAYLLASSRNPRQFIQRRGRILRKSDNKEKATIYDFVVVLPETDISDKNRQVDFLRNELERVADFAKNSIKPMSSLDPLRPWLIKYDLEHLVI